MAQGTSRSVVLVAAGARTQSGNANAQNLPSLFRSARVRLKVSAASGTSPTLNVFIQQGIVTPAASDAEGQDATGAIEWDDYATFRQLTGTGTRYIYSTQGGQYEAAQSSGTMAQGQVLPGPLGVRWRVLWTIGGTNPSFTFSVVAEFIP